MKRVVAIAFGVLLVLLIGVRPVWGQVSESTSTTDSLPSTESVSPDAESSLAFSEPESSGEDEPVAESETSTEDAEPTDANDTEETDAASQDCDTRDDTVSLDCQEEEEEEVESAESDSGGGITGRAADSVIDRFSQAAMLAAGELLKMLLGWWLLIPSPALQDTAGLYEKVNGYTRDLQLVLLTASLMMVALRISLARRGMIEGTVYETTGSFIKIILASAVWVPLIMMLMHAGDVFSAQIIGEGAQDAIEEFIAASVTTKGFLPLIVAVFSIITGLIQMVLLFVRAALLILVAAIIPLAAAAGGTMMGRETYQRLQSWTIALLLFKPAGSIVYFIALEALDNASTLSGLVAGLMLFGMAVLTLPALLKLIAPATDSIGTGPSGMDVSSSAIKAGGMAVTGAGTPGALMKLAGGASSMGAGGAGASGGASSGGAAGPADFSSASGGASAGGGGSDGGGSAGLTSGAQEAGAAGGASAGAASAAGGAAAGAATGGVSTAVGAAASAAGAAADTVSSTVNDAAGGGGSSGGTAGPANMSSSPAPGTAPIDQLSASQSSDGNGFAR